MRNTFDSNYIISAALIALFALFNSACGASETEHHDVESIVVEEQPGRLVAGETASVSFRLMDSAGKPFRAPGVTIHIRTNKHSFATGERTVSATTDADGVARFEFTINKADKGYVLTATSDHAALKGVSTNTLEFEVAMGGLSDIAVVSQPTAPTVEDLQKASFQLTDAGGNPIEQEGVEITMSLNKNFFGDEEVQRIGKTNANGVVSFEFTIKQAGMNYILTATSPDAALEGVSTETSSFDVYAGPASAELSTISASLEPNSYANDEDAAQITVNLVDIYGSPIFGTVPVFAATGPGNTYGPCSESDQDGVSICTMTSKVGGQKSVYLTKPVEIEADAPVEFLSSCDRQAEPFGGGDGSANNPFQLCTPAHLAAIGSDRDYMKKNYAIAETIDMSDVENFRMIGNESGDDGFEGHFDGDFKSIKNLVINRPDAEVVGFFTSIRTFGVVENIILENVEVVGGETVGGLVGYNQGTIRSVYVEGHIDGGQGTYEGTYGSVGGLVGRIYNGRVFSSQAEGSVVGHDRVGGLVGEQTRGEIVASHATGDVSGTNGVGGLVGDVTEGAVRSSYATNRVEGEYKIGGLVGGQTFGEITSSYATSSVVGGSAVGGLVGYSDKATIRSSYATGDVEGVSRVGGLVGERRDDENISSYWDKTTSGHNSSAGGTGLNTSQFGTATIFSQSDWDFINTWVMGTAPDGKTRPILQWQVD